MSLKIFISAGEASGDIYGAQLIEAVRRASLGDNVQFFGLGGERMRAQGCEIVIDSKRVAIVGLFEVIKHLPGIYSKFHKLLREIDQRKPDVAVLIDFPDFNLRLARELHKRGIPVVYFVSPQLWAWRKGRIKQVRQYVSKMLVIFPFEEKFYRDHGVDAEYVGHPLADLKPTIPDRQQYARENSLNPNKQWIALLPGSRKQEIERHFSTLLQVADALGAGFEYLLPVASTLDPAWLQSQLRHSSICLVKDAPTALSLARASVVASGTATVEAALAGNPFIVVYRVSPLTWALGRRLVSLPNFAMPNLIAGRTIVPELIQSDFFPSKVVTKLKELIPDGPARSRMIADLAEVRRKLTGTVGSNPTLSDVENASTSETAADRAAAAVLSVARDRLSPPIHN